MGDDEIEEGEMISVGISTPHTNGGRCNGRGRNDIGENFHSTHGVNRTRSTRDTHVRRREEGPKRVKKLKDPETKDAVLVRRSTQGDAKKQRK